MILRGIYPSPLCGSDRGILKEEINHVSQRLTSHSISRRRDVRKPSKIIKNQKLTTYNSSNGRNQITLGRRRNRFT